MRSRAAVSNRCPHADTVRRLVFTRDGFVLCTACYAMYADRAVRGTVNVRTGKKIWLGHEVYGNRLGSDELRVDTEQQLTRRNYPLWFVERMQKRGMPERLHEDT